MDFPLAPTVTVIRTGLAVDLEVVVAVMVEVMVLFTQVKLSDGDLEGGLDGSE